jgi:hypothetical protein
VLIRILEIRIDFDGNFPQKYGFRQCYFLNKLEMMELSRFRLRKISPSPGIKTFSIYVLCSIRYFVGLVLGVSVMSATIKSIGNKIGRLAVTSCLGSLALVGSFAWGAIAQKSNFGEIKVSSNPSTVTGTTGGNTSLSAIAGNQDSSGAPCIGFGDPTPDHTMTLTKKVSRLSFQVDSKGVDTTIVILGPDGDLRCGDDTGSKKDASLEDADWKPGVYQIWVGSMKPSIRQNYRLTVKS